MSKDQEIIQAEQTIKKRGRGGKYNFPSTVEPENPEDVKAVLGSVLHWYKRGTENKCVTDEDIQRRTTEYFETCLQVGDRPTVESYCLALGYVRTTVNEWERGNNTSRERMDMIKKAKEFIAAYDAGMVTNGKMNPVPYIFRAKNYYGMRDQTDITIEPKQGITEQTAEEVATKYQELPD